MPESLEFGHVTETAARLAAPHGAVARRLHELIESRPIPTTPPTYLAADAALGLTLLDMSLRLVHVSRLSEHLRLIDRGHVTRSVSVDVDMSSLTLSQRQILAAEVSDQGDAEVWVPISRYDRSDLAPVVVRDSGDDVVPRMTHRETKQAMAAAILRLLDMLVEEQWASEGEASVQRLLLSQRARWLLEVAVTELVDSGIESTPRDSRRSGTPRSPELPEVTDSRPASIRTLAHAALDALLARSQEPFEQLLQHACREYMLVVLLPAAEARVFLKWEAPLLPAQRPRAAGWFRRVLRATLPVNREFAVEYSTTLPRAVKSYHLTVEVSEEIHVRRFLLSSNVDDPFVEALAADLDAIAAGLPAFDFGDDAGVRTTEAKLGELELQSVASRLAELGRRRRSDLVSYERYIESAAQKFGVTVVPKGTDDLSSEGALVALRDGDCSIRVLSSFADAFAAGRYPHLARDMTPEDLRRVADGLRSAQVGRDVTTDNDPREHGAHAHWRQPTTDLTPKSSESVEAVAYLALADEAPALIESITRMVIGLVVVVIGIGCLLQPGFAWTNPWAWSEDTRLAAPKQADAVVAVLLLVPGLMLARLDLPSTNSVLGQIRRSQRAMATLSVCVTTVLAMVVGTVESPEGLTISFWLAAFALLTLAALCGVEFVFRGIRRRGHVPRSSKIPRWLRLHFTSRVLGGSSADAVFSSGSP